VDLGGEILGFDGNCLVFIEKFSAKLLTCKFKKMAFVFCYSYKHAESVHGFTSPCNDTVGVASSFQ